ncbi:MAG: succinylglutamate desuccinylase/aspartoacylase family protein [Saprospiraceae bacterium]|nr:succinylglutamate desuccinylase/aspartoacylase family protein [Saprospiraceae bacterium]MDG2418972.1 succinylglutamate desuccinylase/aspartoacylase family protein [Saprospiraceae bacterium]
MLFQIEENATFIKELNVEDVPKGTIARFWLRLVMDGIGVPVHIPVMVARGKRDGKVLGLTAAVHGNELNGIPVIQRLFKELNLDELKGTIVGVPVINMPSLHRKKRRFIDGTDLNHIMPGKPNGTVSQIYAWRVVNRLVKEFDYLIDLHTASNGRINSYYIRADMDDATVRKMALLQNAQIIVHNPPSDGTLRGTADEMGIKAITLEVGNPNTFQKGLIRDGLTGIYNVLGHFDMQDCEYDEPDEETIICKNSYWIYTDTGGIMTVHPKVVQLVKKGELIATMRNIFGDVVKEYFAPEDGVVIGKSVSPINQTGGRILHLGILK